MFTARYGLGLQIKRSALRLSRVYLRTNSDLCHLQHKLIGLARYELGL